MNIFVQQLRRNGQTPLKLQLIKFDSRKKTKIWVTLHMF